MSEVNTTFIPKKFVDFEGLDYFWEKAKAYIDEQHVSQDEQIATLGTEVKNIHGVLDSLASGEGSISSQINAVVAPVADNLSAHTGDMVAHITADERSAWNDAKTAIDAFLKDSDMTQNAVDTLAELQAYMVADGAAAAELVNRVAALESIDHEAYVAYADNKSAEANADAKAYTDSKVDGKFDAIGSAEAAKMEAMADAAAKIASLSTVYDALGSAAVAEANSKAYAKTYTDALYDAINSVENSVIDAIFA